MKYQLLVFVLFLFETYSTNVIEVNTTSGYVRGKTLRVLNKTVNQFLGIPYAEPPIGELRFAKPVPISSPSKKPIDTTLPKKSCVQTNRSYMNYIKDYGEDCLVLNIWSPDSGQRSNRLKPVMFFIHGGGLVAGSIYQTEFNGSVLATHDVVLVAANYRLSVLGFLYGSSDSAPGNVGLLDQIQALKWVRENIHNFGGDKDRITIFGQSAGGFSVSAHVMSPLSKDLFSRAIISSGANYHKRGTLHLTKEEALLKTRQLATSLNCSDNQWLSCLRKVSAQDIIKYGANLGISPVEGTEFLPINAQTAFEQGQYNKDLELMAGVVKDEGSALSGAIDNQILFKNTTLDYFNDFINKTNIMLNFSDIVSLDEVRKAYLKGIDQNDQDAIRWKLFDLFGDLVTKCPTYHFAKQYAQHSADKSKVFFYELTHAPNPPHTDIIGLDVDHLKQMGVTHSSDNMYVFGVPFILSDIWEDETDFEFSRQVMREWTDFAKYGKPSDNSKSMFTDFNAMVKNLKPNSVNEYLINLFNETCDGIWNKYFN